MGSRWALLPLLTTGQLQNSNNLRTKKKMLFQGDVYAVDDSTIFIKSFAYDGTGPDAFFWVGKTPRPSPEGYIIPYPEEYSGRWVRCSFVTMWKHTISRSVPLAQTREWACGVSWKIMLIHINALWMRRYCTSLKGKINEITITTHVAGHVPLIHSNTIELDRHTDEFKRRWIMMAKQIFW